LSALAPGFPSCVTALKIAIDGQGPLGRSFRRFLKEGWLLWQWHLAGFLPTRFKKIVGTEHGFADPLLNEQAGFSPGFACIVSITIELGTSLALALLLSFLATRINVLRVVKSTSPPLASSPVCLDKYGGAS
jgi:hypothetical protein